MKHFSGLKKRSLESRLMMILISFCYCISLNANATVVEFQTSLGNFEVNLTDETTPVTVANFLKYVEDGDYINSVFHRSEEDFVIQGGGYTVDVELPLNVVPQDAAITNEPGLPNIRGTIAMAKLGGDPNSATSEWFFNLTDNRASLDSQNGGFTVFGEVVGDGMDVVDAIAALPTYNFDGAFTDLPLRDYAEDDFVNAVPVDTTKLVVVSAIVITDATITDAAVEADSDFLANRASGVGPLLMLVLGILLFSRSRRRSTS